VTRLTIQGSLKTLSITIQAASETLQGTPTTLPTSEPGTPQISYTVAQGDLPTLSPTVASVKYIGMVFGAGKVVTAGTISWDMKKNGSSVKTGSFSVAANYYYTVQACFYNVVVGDQLQLALWSNQTDSNWDYNAYQIHPTRVYLFAKLPVLMPCNFTANALYPTLSSGNPSVVTTSSPYLEHADSYSVLSATGNYSCVQPLGTYGLYRCYYGDATTQSDGINSTSATYRPYYRQHRIPTTIQMRAVRIMP
jgi:hypothetical protein